jgi:hypothetical protein
MSERLSLSNPFSGKTNLYYELVELLKCNEKTVDDIAWVECNDYPKASYPIYPVRCRIPIDNFIDIAKNTFYDPLAWTIQIPMSLKIYGKERSFLVEVDEYDGRQKLEYIDMEKTAPEKTRMVKSLKVEHGDYYHSPIWETAV